MNTSLRSPMIAVALAAVFSLTACASSMQSGRTSAPTTADVYGCGGTPAHGVVRRITDGLTATDIAMRVLTGRTAYDVVQVLQPEYLEARAPGAPLGTRAMKARVIIDDDCEGNLPVLMRVPIDQIQRLDFVTPAEGATRYGREYGGGVILIHTKQYRSERLARGR